MRIIISHQSGVPFYEQVKEQIKASVLSGEVPQGEPLPSIRQLARDLKVSVITTTRAYNDLEIEGFIQTIPGKGCYVKKVDESLIKEQYTAEVKTALAAAVRHGKLAGLTTQELHKLLSEAEEDI
ncbi:MAG: GntR family transcriptional regulator [Oscillospiraceae bacterium]|nr:GntR family transcriptional regulator [Oscillospiraceae bacterium]